MATPDLEVIKDIPGYKVILKAILKSQIQQLVEQLATTTDEESVILTASVSDGTLSHLGSDSGKGFLEDHEDIKSQFLGFCLKRHHRKKQQEKEKEEAELAAARMPKTPTRYGGPRPGFGRSPRFQSPRQQGPPHPIALSRVSPGHGIRSPGVRHEPYPMNRPPPPRRASLNFEQGRGPGMSPGMRLPPNLDGQIIKIEADDPNSDSNQSDSGTHNAPMSGPGTPVPLSSQPPSSPSQNTPTSAHIKSEASDRDDDAQSDTSNSTIPNEASDLQKFNESSQPPDGLSLGADLSGLINQDINTSAGEPQASSSESMDPNVNVKIEAITETEMELEITGVEPGRMPMSTAGSHDQSWGSDGQGGMMGYDPSGATGNQGDMQGQDGYSASQDPGLSNMQLVEYSLGVRGGMPIKGEYSLGVQGGMPGDSGKIKVLYCDICGKPFPSKWELTRHRRIHTGEKPFKCEYCDKAFGDKSNKNQHVRGVHLRVPTFRKK